jgi:hypothetical protein
MSPVVEVSARDAFGNIFDESSSKRLSCKLLVMNRNFADILPY